MSWLKTTDEKVPLEKEAVRSYLDDAISRWRSSQEPFARYYVDAFQSVRASLLGSPLPSEKSTGSVYDNPQYQRQDENKGESGEFDKEHIDQERKDKGVDVGPTSLTPGTPNVLSPQVFD